MLFICNKNQKNIVYCFIMESYYQKKNKDKIFNSSFNIPENIKNLPFINKSIDDFTQEIDNNIYKLRDENKFKIFKHYKKENSKSLNRNNHIRLKKGPIRIKTKTNQNSTIDMSNFFKQNPIKIRLNKIKNKEQYKNNLILSNFELKPKFKSNNVSLNQTNSISKTINSNLNHKFIVNEINDIDNESSVTTKKLFNQTNKVRNINLIKFIRKKLKKDNKLLFMYDEKEYLKPKYDNPFKIPSKKNIFFKNLDSVIMKLKNDKDSTNAYLRELKNLNKEKSNYYNHLYQLKRQNNGFKRFDELLDNGELLIKKFEEKYHYYQKKIEKSNK